MGVKTHVRGQLFGYKELPDESGLWGVLLPRPGDTAVAHEPDAQDVIQQIAASRLIFGNSETGGNRGRVVPYRGHCVDWLGVCHDAFGRQQN